jgi:hypothetical protein
VRIQRVFLVVAVVASTACGSGSTVEQRQRSAHPPVLGPQPVVAVELWPDRWGRVVAALPPPAREAIGGRDVWALAREAAAVLQIEGGTFPPPGLASDAPITVELYASVGRVEEHALAIVRAAKARKAPAPVPMPRMRIAFEATDPAALAASLQTLRAPAFHHAVTAAGSRVTLEISFGDTPGEPLPPRPQVITFEGSGASAARVVARIDDLGTLGTATNLARVASAFAEGGVPDASALRLASAGLAESFVPYVLFDPVTTFARTVVVDIPAEEGQGLRYAFDLGEGGMVALTAGGLARGKTAVLSDIAWDKAISSAPLPPVLEAAPGDKRGLSQIAKLTHECGASCFAYPLFGNVLAFARAGGITMDEVANGLAATGISWATVKTFRIAWTDDDLAVLLPGDKTSAPRWTLARTAPASIARACYLRALVPVRDALAAADGAAWEAATKALAAAESCTKPEPELAARLRVMRELVTELTP